MRIILSPAKAVGCDSQKKVEAVHRCRRSVPFPPCRPGWMQQRYLSRPRVQRPDYLVDIGVIGNEGQSAVCHGECYPLRIGSFSPDKVNFITGLAAINVDLGAN